MGKFTLFLKGGSVIKIFLDFDEAVTFEKFLLSTDWRNLMLDFRVASIDC